ncbi:hypothetical protein BDK51DRAFT_40117 [Blyttiomyces helicus]|uniref:PIPK domain-containing protein n=1 Tax=Blyttiomyces helicus TaxID=388810 RepID=A0A4P9WCV6_9FUNG|nr:hypothetical protein BDK51DRAFT_40117 [Blyttiomyces helicus]|eukprot:RKO89058.1 hypothetical protein BDK51DRAFT_40117 [Blyttiomyces helicus]
MTPRSRNTTILMLPPLRTDPNSTAYRLTPHLSPTSNPIDPNLSVSVDFVWGAFAGTAMLAFVQVVFRLWTRRKWRHSDYEPIPDDENPVSEHSDYSTFEETVVTNISDTAPPPLEEARSSLARDPPSISHPYPSAPPMPPPPPPPDQSSGSSSASRRRRRRGSGSPQVEPAAAKHFRTAVHAALHFVEVSPEVAAYPYVFADAPGSGKGWGNRASAAKAAGRAASVCSERGELGPEDDIKTRGTGMPRNRSSFSPETRGERPPDLEEPQAPETPPAESQSTEVQPTPLRRIWRSPSLFTPKANAASNRAARPPNPLARSGSTSQLPSLSASPAPPSPPLTPRFSLDRHLFSAEHHYEWVIPSYGRIRFTDYCPVAFKAVRIKFGYSVQDLDRALAKAFAVEMSDGKSDAIFFATHDDRFLFKTLRGAEPENLKSFLYDYLGHIGRNPGTLLPRYLGLYTFERLTSVSPPSVSPAATSSIPSAFASQPATTQSAAPRSPSPAPTDDSLASLLSSRFTVVLMANVCDTDLDVHVKYDFKGSNIGRSTLATAFPPASSLNPSVLSSPMFPIPTPLVPTPAPPPPPTRRRASATFLPDVDWPARLLPAPAPPPAPLEEMDLNIDMSQLTLKEVDYQRLVSAGRADRLYMGQEMRTRVMKQVEEDVALLRKHGFMDYSMLVGVHRRPKPPQPAAEPPATPPSTSPKHPTPSHSPTQSPSRTQSLPPPSTLPSPPGSPQRLSVGSALESYVPPAIQTSTLYRSAVAMLAAVVGANGAEKEEEEERGREGGARSARASRSPPTPSRSPDGEGLPQTDEAPGPQSEPAPADGVGVDAGVEEPRVEEVEQWEDRSTPFHKRFNGGIRSVGLISDVYEYEVYYLGMIDILQKYTYAKWLERGIKRETNRLFSNPTPLASMFAPSAISAAPASPPSPPLPPLPTPRANTPPAIVTKRRSHPPSNDSNPAPPSPSKPPDSPGFLLPGMDAWEMSVEEPGRYAERLVEFIRGIIA